MFTELLRMQGITKNYPGVKALTSVDFDLKVGEVHALVGENGAGKSTLMKILAGAINKDGGEILINGNELSFRNTQDSQKQGIALIYQERSLIPYLNGEQNILLGHEPVLGKIGFLKRKELKGLAMAAIEMIAPNIPLNKPVKYLSAAQQQLIEIAKAISLKANIIIMDEPTSSISDNEVAHLFEVIRKLKAEGKGIVYISHRLNEIFTITDRITVLRDGCKINTVNTSEATHQTLVNMMVGRNIDTLFAKSEIAKGKELLRIENFTSRNYFENISFSLKAGEVLGISGLVGAGRTELVRAIFGADKYESGSAYVNEKPVIIKSPKDAINKGIGLVPEDRKLQGLVLGMSIKENMLLTILRKICFMGLINKEKQTGIYSTYIKSLSVKAYSGNQRARNLSGGNQQKVVIAKWLASGCEILILDEPTRGIDVGAKHEIYTLIDKLAQSGKGIILISSELPEILGMSDRVIVLKEGHVVAEFMREEASEENIMQSIVGEK